MSDAAEHLPVRPRARTAAGRRRVRRALAAAAVELFLKQGYEATTVDEIAEAAGVGRRTFFRYFASKEDAIFPDHDERLTEIARHFDTAPPTDPPLAVVCAAAELVLRMYIDDADISLKRFSLTRTVPSLRDKEIASVDRYQRLFAGYLRNRFQGEPNADVRAAIGAAGVVAAHNQVLRQWLKSKGTADVQSHAREAFLVVQDAFGSPHAEPACQTGDEDGDEIVVAVLRTDASLRTVVQRLEDVMRDHPCG